MSEDRKAKIRERYKGNSAADIKVIPALEQPSFYEDFSEKRVAVYARVSTGSANQTSSYELQKGYYEQDVTRHPGWKLVRIYADEGISGTSLSHRDEFVQKIKDCEAGKIDLIITKSVSRFSRNVLVCCKSAVQPGMCSEDGKAPADFVDTVIQLLAAHTLLRVSEHVDLHVLVAGYQVDPGDSDRAHRFQPAVLLVEQQPGGLCDLQRTLGGI